MNKTDIKEQIVERLQNMDEKQRYMVFGGILLFVFLVDYFLLMKPQLDALYKVNSDSNVVSGQLKEAKDNIQKKDFYIKEVDKLKEKVVQSNEKVKTKDEVPFILEKISLLADQNNIKIDQILPNSENQELVLEDNSKKYYSLPIFIQARSNYHNFGRFINGIENSNIFFNIKSFTVTATENDREHKILLTLDAIIYETVSSEVAP